MKSQDKKFSSNQFLEKIGCNMLPDSSLGFLDEEGLDSDITPLLRERYHQLKVIKHALHPEMMVMWKPGLQNRKWPAYGKPSIVISVLETPVIDDEGEPGSTYFREPLDLVIGFFVDLGEHHGEFLTFHANSGRYQPWHGEEA